MTSTIEPSTDTEHTATGARPVPIEVTRRLRNARRLLSSAIAAETETRAALERAERVHAVQADMVRRHRTEVETLERHVARGTAPSPTPPDFSRPVLGVVRSSAVPVGAKTVHKRIVERSDVGGPPVPSLGRVRAVLRTLASKGCLVDAGGGKYLPAP